MRAHEGVTHVCDCGVEFTLTSRAEYSRVKDGRAPICRDCRFPLAVVVTESMVEWWRDRGWTPESALELWEGAFGSPASWEGIREAIVPGGFTGAGDAERMSA